MGLRARRTQLDVLQALRAFEVDEDRRLSQDQLDGVDLTAVRPPVLRPTVLLSSPCLS